LRHPLAGSSIADLSEKQFQPVLDDPYAAERRDRVTRLIVCSGKIWAELVSNKAYEAAESVAAIRLEQLYPFPERELKETMGRFKNVRDVIWLQEEPKNMGAWLFVETSLRELVGSGMLRYIGRSASSSPAEGSLRSHTAEQKRILSEALADLPKFSKNGAQKTQTKPRQRVAH
jgi:2-oxoglutarate dehydrogenase E1 component